MTNPPSSGDTPKPTKVWDYEWCDCIVCPYCGTRDEERTDYPTSLKYDGDTTTVECASCEEGFSVRLCVEYTYQSFVLGAEP